MLWKADNLVCILNMVNNTFFTLKGFARDQVDFFFFESDHTFSDDHRKDKYKTSLPNSTLPIVKISISFVVWL